MNGVGKWIRDTYIYDTEIERKVNLIIGNET